MNQGHVPEIHVKLDRVVFTVLVSCLLAEAVLFVLDVLLNLAELWYLEKFKQLSDVAREKSFGTWFSVVQNFAVALTALLLAIHYRRVMPERRRCLGWLLIAAFFAYISLDDDLMLHERIGGTVGPLVLGRKWGEAGTLPTYEWHYLLGPFFAAFGFFFLAFVYRNLEGKSRRVLFITGLCLWGVAQLLDALEGTRNPYGWFLRRWGVREVYVRHSFMLMEEMMEMVGSTLFLYLFLGRLAQLYKGRRMILSSFHEGTARSADSSA